VTERPTRVHLGVVLRINSSPRSQKNPVKSVTVRLRTPLAVQLWLPRPQTQGSRARRIAAKEGSMLTLTRKAGQKIRIGDDIEIVVREIRGRQVRLGISAPDGLVVYREELYQQLLGEESESQEDGSAPSERVSNDENK
jgi:carbon storage regulator